jgi:hypothetical protein
LHNLFLPSIKLVEKERVGSQTIKRHDPPKTPYQRIMASTHVPDSVKQTLSKPLEKLNPFLLRIAMERKLKKILSL